MRIFQKGFNYSQDGPGNRLVYHMQGCNMSCLWCSNPEGMDFGGGILVTPEEIAEECERCRMMFFEGGGVTFTGGEPTAQFDELKKTLELLKDGKIHTAIETNGTNGRLPELFGLIDYLIMDFKHYDSEKLRHYTGVGNETVKSNFESIAKSGRQALIHIPIINGFNSEPEGFVSYFTRFDLSNISFELLPYHEYGKDKWTKKYQIENGFVTEETLNKFISLFKENNIKLIRT